MHLEGCGDALLVGKQASVVGIDLADLRVRALGSHPIASRRAGGATGEVVALVRGEDEQGVALVGTVPGKALEELGEGCVLPPGRRAGTRRTRAVRRAARMAVLRGRA